MIYNRNINSGIIAQLWRHLFDDSNDVTARFFRRQFQTLQTIQHPQTDADWRVFTVQIENGCLCAPGI